MSLSKAKLIVKRGGREETIEVMFNPGEYTVDSSHTYAKKKVPGLQNSIDQFVSGNESSLKVELFFDTYAADTDVRVHTQKIASLMDIDSETHAPPAVRFVWGSLDFSGVVEQVSQRFTLFLDNGWPARATLSVTFKSVQSLQEQYREIPRHSADRTKQKTVKHGDELWMIAAEEYEDPGKWRHIAEANGIDNPRRLQAGRKLTIPRLE